MNEMMIFGLAQIPMQCNISNQNMNKNIMPIAPQCQYLANEGNINNSLVYLAFQDQCFNKQACNFTFGKEFFYQDCLDYIKQKSVNSSTNFFAVPNCVNDYYYTS